MPSPAGAGAAQPSLVEAPGRRVLLTWQEPAADGHALRLATLADGAWSEVRTVAIGRPFFVNWADFPTAVPLGEDRFAVHWLEREGTDTYAYGVRVAFSDDGGRTWSAPVRPHADSTETEHGFVSMLPAESGAVHAVWLDGRNFAADRPEMTLRAALVTPAGVSQDALLDGRICDCCQTDAARTASGDVVVYRDRSADEIRDIALVRRTAQGWSAPTIVHEDGWHIEGCPVNGPAVAARGDLVAVAWFTAARDSARVLLAFSADGGVTFDAPVRIDEAAADGRVDVQLTGDDAAVVSWVETADSTPRLRVRAMRRAGQPGPAVEVAAVPGGRAAGFARMAPSGASLVIAWRDVRAETIRVARIEPAP